MDAVADTLEAADLSDKALFADDIDPALMATRLRRQHPSELVSAALGQARLRHPAPVADQRVEERRAGLVLAPREQRVDLGELSAI